jgi:hypothetical protein
MKFVAGFGPQEGSIMVSHIECQILAAMILAKLQLDYFPSLVKFIPVFVHIKKVEMVVEPCGMFAFITNLISCLLESKHIDCGFRPLATHEGKFLPKARGKFIDVEDVNSL